MPNRNIYPSGFLFERNNRQQPVISILKRKIVLYPREFLFEGSGGSVPFVVKKEIKKTESVSDSMKWSDVLDWKLGVLVSDTVKFNETLSSSIVTLLFDTVHFNEAIVANQTVNESISDSLEFNEYILGSIGQVLEDNVKFNDAVTELRKAYASLSDSIDLNETITPSGRVYKSLSENIIFNDVLSNSFGATLSDTIKFNDAVSIVFSYYLSDNIKFNETLNVVKRIIMSISDILNMNDSVSVSQKLKQSLEDGISFGGSFVLGDDTYDAWVLNSDVFATSQYTGYNFNSISGNLAANSTNIYLIGEADDDAGTDIDAYFTTGLLDFGSNQLKTIPEAYVGYTTDGRILLKVRTSQSGANTEDWYEVTNTYATEHESRFTIGRGLSSKYFQWKVENVDGADFDIDTITFFPAIFKRRLR